MISKQPLVILLIISLLPLMTGSPSQVSTSLTTVLSSSTLTSYSTYTVGMTQVTSTVTNTIYNGNLPLPAWTAGGCVVAAFGFNASLGDQLNVNFASDTPIDFYLMSLGQFERVPPSTTLCSLGAIPVFPALHYVSYQTSYSYNWSPTIPGLYYVVLMDLQAEPAAAVLSATVTSLKVGSLALNGTTTTTIVNVNSQTLSTLVTFQTSTAASEGLSTQGFQWIAAALVIVVLVVAFLISRRKQTPRTS